MQRDAIEEAIRDALARLFEVDDPQMDADLRETYEFDSIDAIELLGEIEKLLASELTREEKKRAMEIRSMRQVCDYVEMLARAREQG